ARPRRAAPVQCATGRHLRPRAAERFLRRRHHPPGAALPRRRRARDRRGGARAAARRAPAGGRLRAAPGRVPARPARPSPAPPCAPPRGAVDPPRAGSRPRGAAAARAGAGLAGQDRGPARARARPAHRACRAGRPGGRMNAPRPSRFVHSGERRIRVSFEFFPPKTEEMEKTLWESITRLAPLSPNFVSVTYGAGGSTRERTHATVKRTVAETALTPAAHLTCVAATCGEIDEVIRSYHAAGVRHIVALRGDPVGGIGEKYAPHPGGYENGADLVAGIKRIADV